MEIKLYYIKLSPYLPDHYRKLSLEFSFYQITVIPVEYSDLAKLIQKEPQSFFFIETQNLPSKNLFEKEIKRSLYLSLFQKNIKVFHLSSFLPGASLLRFKKAKKYYHFGLPVDLVQLCQQISYEILLAITQDLSWPGKNKNSPYKIIFDKKGV